MNPLSRLSKPLRTLAIAVTGLLALQARQATAQQPGAESPLEQTVELKKQLEQMKQQYAAATQNLEKRIAALEEQLEKQKGASEKGQLQQEEAAANAKKGGVVSVQQVAQQAAQEAVQGALAGGSNQVGAKFQGQLPLQPTYDVLQEAESKIEGLERQVGTFEFHVIFARVTA